MQAGPGSLLGRVGADYCSFVGQGNDWGLHTEVHEKLFVYESSRETWHRVMGGWECTVRSCSCWASLSCEAGTCCFKAARGGMLLCVIHCVLVEMPGWVVGWECGAVARINGPCQGEVDKALACTYSCLLWCMAWSVC
jgi:hypothetical protein